MDIDQIKYTLSLVMMTCLILPLAAQAADGLAALLAASASSTEYFHPKGKMPSVYTIKILEAARKGYSRENI